jgi:hypothetical protein
LKRFLHIAIGVSKQTEVNFWTSGFKDTKCDNWCTNKGANESISPSINWLQKSPKNPLVDRCVTVDLNTNDASKSGLKFAECSNMNQFICEVKISKFSERSIIKYGFQTMEVTCPPYDDGAKNVILI